MKHSGKSRVYMTLSMVIFGTVAVFVRGLSLSPGEIALCRSAIAAVPIGLFLLFTKQRIGFDAWKREGLLLLLSGASLGINWLLLFESYRYTTVSTATLCYYFAPVIVTVVSPILFHERLTKGQILCFLMSTAGLVLITGFSDLGADGKGIAFGLGAACFYALTVLLNKGIKGVAGLPKTFLQLLSAGLVLLVYVICTGGFHLQTLDGKGILMLLIVGLLHTGVAYCLYFTAIAGLDGQQIAIMSYIDPLVAVLISVFFLSEPISIWQIAGGLLILVFSFLNEWLSIRRVSPQEKRRNANEA